jgi:hypothetical protein
MKICFLSGNDRKIETMTLIHKLLVSCEKQKYPLHVLENMIHLRESPSLIKKKRDECEGNTCESFFSIPPPCPSAYCILSCRKLMKLIGS